MSTLFIDRKDTRLNWRDGVLSVSTPDAPTPRHIPAALMNRVVIRAHCQLDTQTLAGLSAAGVALTILAGRGGQHMAQLCGPAHGDARRRWHQALQLAQPEFCAQVAHRVVYSKLLQQARTLKTLAHARPDLRKPFFDAQAQIQERLAQLRLLGLPGEPAPSLNTLRGLEGAAAAAYFQAYFKAFAPSLNATGRNRRPPLDPVNAVLSLSYTLLASLATQACCTVGLDPALGALHAPAHRRPALACDLMEPLRPVVDAWVWQLFRSETLRASHFAYEAHGACLLGKAGRGLYWPLWQQQVHGLQRKLQRYAMALVRQFNPAHTAYAHLEWNEEEQEGQGE